MGASFFLCINIIIAEMEQNRNNSAFDETQLTFLNVIEEEFILFLWWWNNRKILIINPGGTSTKIAVFEDDQELFKASIDHTAEELKPYTHVFDEFEYRKNLIVKTVEEAGYSISDFGCVAGRGGLCRPVEGGTYAVNDRMIEDFRNIEWNRKKIFL